MPPVSIGGHANVKTERLLGKDITVLGLMSCVSVIFVFFMISKFAEALQ